MMSLTDSQKAALEAMKLKFSSVYVSEPLDSLFYVDDKCLLRYLRARNYDVTKATAMLEATIAWRKSYGVDNMLQNWRDCITKENATGKMYVRGFDKQGHAIIYMKPKLENTGDFEGNIRHLVFTMEVAVKTMNDAGKGAEKMILIVDYDGWSLSNSPPFQTSKETMNVLQNHYPERLFKAVCVQPPFMFSVFWAAISPFIDRVTQEKVLLLRYAPEVVTQKILELVDEEVLESAYGGSDKKPFSSVEYLSMYFPSDT